MVNPFGKPDTFQHFDSALTALLAREPACRISQRHDDIVQRRRPGKQIEALEHKTYLAVPHHRAMIPRGAPEFFAVEQIIPRSRTVQAAENVHQRALSRTGSAHQRHVFPLADRERDSLENRNVNLSERIGFPDIFEFDKRHGAPPYFFFAPGCRGGFGRNGLPAFPEFFPGAAATATVPVTSSSPSLTSPETISV